MLRGIYAPSDFKSKNLDPTMPVAQKLEIIANSPVTVEPILIPGKTYGNNFWATLPFVSGGYFMSGSPRIDDLLYSDYIDVGDKELYQHGIGSRLLRAACRYSVERNPKLAVFATGWARLGLVNTVVKVMGLENVGVDHLAQRYGWQGRKPLEELFDDFPPEPDKRYVVNAIIARIDRDQAMEWEAPVYRLPENKQSA